MTAPSLYIHIPFCVRLCDYCDFYSGVASRAQIDAYLDALDREFELRYPRGLTPPTLFIGGGTPTRLSAPQLRRLGGILRRRVDLSHCAEFTIEINPSTLTPAKADALIEMGVSRASIGVQSFSPRFLKELGRAYEQGTAATAVEIARSAGIKRISVDLIYALPGQELADLTHDLDCALALGTEHVSLYALTFEDDTPLTQKLANGEVKPCPIELEREMFLLAGEVCATAGLPRYEVSNFAGPGAECAHNLVYWQGGDWAGLGVAAHSMLAGTVTANGADFGAYTRALLDESRLPIMRTDKLSGAERAEALLLMGLRLVKGIDRRQFEALAQVDFEAACAEPAAKLAARGLLEFDRDRIRVTPDGMLLLDTVILELAAALEVAAP